MARQGGRPRRSSEAQRNDVLRRVASGESDRRIAQVVFGDARYRGRVERIRRQAANNSDETSGDMPRVVLRVDPEAPPADAAYWRELVSHARRALERRLEQGETVSARELAALLKLEQQVANLEQFERLRELTRAQAD